MVSQSSTPHSAHFVSNPSTMHCRKFLCFRQDERLETEGAPVPVSFPISACAFLSLYTCMYTFITLNVATHLCTSQSTCVCLFSAVCVSTQANTTLFINHCKTNQNLAVHEEWTYKYVCCTIKFIIIYPERTLYVHAYCSCLLHSLHFLYLGLHLVGRWK